MTILVVRGTTMASDSLLVWNDSCYAGGEKIRRLADGSLCGISGDWDHGICFLDFAIKHEGFTARDLTKFSGVVGLWLKPNGCYLFQGGSMASVNKLSGPFFAEGSGAIAALAAMEAGAGPRKAVQVACKLDPFCGPPIVSKRLKS